ncbi:MAG: serine/threonine protein kinase [Deltaproteobacteria bacterium]|nr:serine/threonine protein kinase [Deltaproteobacteria bacterium]
MEDDILARGAAIGRFVVIRLLGKGGMGEVYAAYDPDLDRNVAIKLLRAGKGNDSADGRTRLMREAQAIARVSHPNVVVVYDAGTFQERVFIAMELVDGNTLGYWMHARKRSWPEVLEVFLAAGRGLAAAHERQLVHRDFKPDNVMIGVDGQIRVMDFGLVQWAGEVPSPSPSPAPEDKSVDRAPFATLNDDIMSTIQLNRPSTQESISRTTPGLLVRTQGGTCSGTPAYMSAEQFRGLMTDARTDQFSFCVALYEALYGERPFAGANLPTLEEAVISDQVRDAPTGSEIPSWIRQALLRGLKSKVAERWPSMNALLAELEKQPAVASRRRFAAAAADKLAGIWEIPRGDHPMDNAAKAEMRQAFLATGKIYAAKACEGASQILDRYVRRWCDAYVEACEATQVRGEQSAEVLDLRMACLQEGLEDLKALCRMFRQATPEVVENAVSAANALGNLERCDHIDLLRAVVRPPQGAATRDTVAHLRTELAEARALHRVGRFKDGLLVASVVERGARAISYSPMLAETLITVGIIHYEQGSANESAASLEEALWTAVLCRHEEAAAEAATWLVFVVGHLQSRFDVAEIWSRMAETLLRRMGGHFLLYGWLLNNRGTMRETQGRLGEALADARLALAAKQKALEPDHPDLGLSIANIAIALDGLGETAQAVEHASRAVEIVEQGLGADHPRTAVMLSNYGELLVRCGRFDDATEVASRALVVFDREMDRDGLFVTYPLIALALGHLGAGRSAEALPLLERANRIRDRLETVSARRAEVHFALARALWQTGEGAPHQPRALALAMQARDEYQQSPATPAIDRELSAIAAWFLNVNPRTA